MASLCLAVLATLPLVLAGAHAPGGAIAVTTSASTKTTIASYPTTKQCVRDQCVRQVVDGLRYGYGARSSDCAAIFKTITVTPSAVTRIVTASAPPATVTVTSSTSTQTSIGATVLVTTVVGTTTRTTGGEIITTATTTVTSVSTTVATSTTVAITTGPAVVTAQYGKRGNGVKAQVPQWACDCQDTLLFSSACACAGFQQQTVTAPAKTVTSVVLGTSTTTAFVVGLTTVAAITTTTIQETATSDVQPVTTATTTATSIVVTTSSTTTTSQSTVGAIATGSVGYCENGSIVDGSSTGRSGDMAGFRALRIEGRDTTIFEGFVLSSPHSVTTPSGGTHQCQGNNLNPGITPTNLIDDASAICSFDYDGFYSFSVPDYFITRIASTSQVGNQVWGLLANNKYTNAGGCGYIAKPGDETLWAFDVNNKRNVLAVTPKAATLAPGQSLAVNVQGINPNSGAPSAANGASIFGGQLTDASGNTVYTVPVGTPPGTYRFKATRSDSIRSNAIVITVTSG